MDSKSIQRRQKALEGGQAHPPPDPMPWHFGVPARRLIALIQSTHFGRVEDLVVRAGEPVMDPAPRRVHTFKFGEKGSNAPRPQAGAANSALKREFVDLLRALEQLGDGVVSFIEIAYGLPTKMEVSDPPVSLPPAPEGRAV